MGRKKWVKQQDQKHQDYVHVEEMLETWDLVRITKQGMEYCVQPVID
jgi:hypothetical protein